MLQKQKHILLRNVAIRPNLFQFLRLTTRTGNGTTRRSITAVFKPNTNLSRSEFVSRVIGRSCYYFEIKHFNISSMAQSKFEYVRKFESDDRCLPNCWMVVRLDGKGFHKLSSEHDYDKPNDSRALALMTKSAVRVMEEFNEICLAYGQSDEYSFVFKKDSELYNRRKTKIETNICSLFSSSFVYYWSNFFPQTYLKYPPSFDGRVVLYPTNQNLRDYLSWRQADCHINNLYNTAFWALVQQGGYSPSKAEERLRGTVASDKNEILFSEFGINYNNLPELYRKGTILLRRKVEQEHEKNVVGQNGMVETQRYTKRRMTILPLNVDIIGDKFWEENNDILGSYM
ncbi:probable tRNA(His) guanylyltransferase [Limulus polyphemus]|uniref:Probable tRNA(His) guanylyltransferase n=1 Tax=Limulus polyphemus TaxID=6850 RepID=A0ABM1BUJ1_LIMPO|nr:probable tRNA(His) guanylyltransferase [Limulus polyphemus]